MKKITSISLFSLVLIFNLVFYTTGSNADFKNETYNLVQKAQNCYFSLPTYAQEGVIDSYLDTEKYWNDAVKEDKMGDPRNLANAFYRNAQLYAGVVLQIGSAYGSQSCK